MKTVLVTGSEGFIGKNLTEALRRKTEVIIKTFDISDAREVLDRYLEEADIIYHLAGVNRPERSEDYEKVNQGLTNEIIDYLERMNRRPSIVFSSSIQAVLENPYGMSKKKAEEALDGYAQRNCAQVMVFRLPNVFGKWCRPNYNSVVATFCYNIARGLPISISDPSREIELVYIDDVVRAFIACIDEGIPMTGGQFSHVEPSYRMFLGVLAKTIQSFRDSRSSLEISDMSDSSNRALYATYLSYLPSDSFAYPLTQRSDPRGELAELLKSKHVGQIFVSRTRPGIIRGNHYHDTKVEKFIVMEGDAVVRFRHILGGKVVEYPVSGREFRVVEIPPGYTHSIENVGDTDMIVLFWANEIFNPSDSDTFGLPV